MDGTEAGGEESAALSARSDAGRADPSSPSRAAARQTQSSGAAAGAMDGPPANRGGEEEEEDDEQVERFYALLADIRALRGAYVASGGGTRKRARRADTPWRPAFRLEDFEEPSPKTTDVAKRKQRLEADEEEAGERQAVPASSSPPPPRRDRRAFDELIYSRIK